jgi:hypothetical protein
MVYLTFNIIAVSFSLAIIRDRDIFFSYPARIEALSVVFSTFKLTPARVVNRFSAALSTSVKSFP